MLYGLRHNTLVGRDHHQNQIQLADAGEHIANEFFVPGDIDDIRVRILVEHHMREAEVNGDTAALFLRKAVGVNAGKRLNQAGFSVVYVTGSADNHVKSFCFLHIIQRHNFQLCVLCFRQLI